MFNDLVESSLARNSTRKPWTVTVSVIVQFFLLGALVLIPLLYTQALPKAMLNMILMTPVPPAAAPPAVQRSSTPRPLSHAHENIFTAPPAIPTHVDMNREQAPPQDIGASSEIGVPGGVPGGTPNGVIGSILTESTPAAPPASAPTPQRIRLGGNVQAAMLVSQPMPVYPPLARQARIQGNVVLHAIISKDGRVEQLSVLSGHPLLIQAALDAVRQWRYHPTLLNNQPVEVDTTITVTFTMGGN
jgi:periplasmic protein TonB